MADTVKATPRSKTVKPQLTRAQLPIPGKDDPLHIARARNEALRSYDAMDVPTHVGHVWKRTSAGGFIPDIGSVASRDSLMVSRATGEHNSVQFLAGSDLFVTLNDEAQQKGVEVLALTDSPAIIGKVVAPDRGFFEAMNQTLWTTGLYLRIPAGVQLESPINLGIVTHCSHPFVRLSILLEPGASATLVEHVTSSSTTGRTVMVSEVSLGNGASLNHALIFSTSEADTLHYSHGCALENGAGLNMLATSTGSGRVKADLSGELIGERAHSEIRTFGVLQDKTALDFHTRQHHVAPRTLSDMKSRSVLLDRANATHTGLIRIEEAARDSEAYQISRNLMLSKTAQATAIPELEIENNDVMCSHGAATGTLDAMQMFYLQSRGLSKGAATRLIVEGQLDEMLQGQPEHIRELLWNAHADVLARLETREE
ncbi:MAG: SufD family Fe-S cluster assembly protein [Deltaproteobacteria bacterium]|nr:SufD family Fe-S cluster assembly protein [Deltaproteobacteria bacterium]